MKGYGGATTQRHDDFTMIDGKMVLLVSSVGNYSNSSNKPGKAVMKKLITIIKWMIAPDTGLCDKDSGLRNHRNCNPVRLEISEKSGMDAAMKLF